jgi:pilus assembly protein CpaB
MGALRLVIVLLVATVSAIGLAFVVRHMTARPAAVAQAAVPPPRPTVRVLVAKRDLAIGQRLQPEDVAWQTWPKDAANPAFIIAQIDPKQSLAAKAEAALQAATAGDPAVQQVAGAWVREPMVANQPISLRMLVKSGQGGFMAVKLPAGMRAMSTPVTVETGVGGFILPGDHVDVIENIKMSTSGQNSGPTQPVQSHVILRNMTILAIDQAAEPKAGASSLVGTTATLQVAAADIAILAKAREEGTLQLALRSYADMTGPEGTADPEPVARRAPVHVAAVEEDVRIYRGPSVTDTKAP